MARKCKFKVCAVVDLDKIAGQKQASFLAGYKYVRCGFCNARAKIYGKPGMALPWRCPSCGDGAMRTIPTRSEA